MTFADTIKLNRCPAIAFVKGWEGNEAVFAYILMDSTGYKKACCAYENQAITQFKELGEVLVTGRGHVAPESIEQFISQYAASLNAPSGA